jgi:hypothetical protein
MTWAQKRDEAGDVTRATFLAGHQRAFRDKNRDELSNEVNAIVKVGECCCMLPATIYTCTRASVHMRVRHNQRMTGGVTVGYDTHMERHYTSMHSQDGVPN